MTTAVVIGVGLALVTFAIVYGCAWWAVKRMRDRHQDR